MSIPIVTALLLVIAWNEAVTLTGSSVFPKPAMVWSGVIELARTGPLIPYTRDSLIRVGLGYLMSVVVGLPLGTALALSPTTERALNPLIQLLRPISPLAWTPVAIALLGIGLSSTVSLIFIASSLPLTVSTMHAVRSVPLLYLRAGRNFGLGLGPLLLRVLLPAALPELLLGLRLALGISWQVMVAAEMIAVDSGLGYLIVDARNAGKRYDLVVAAMLIIGVIGLLFDLLFRRLEALKRVRWGFRAD